MTPKNSKANKKNDYSNLIDSSILGKGYVLEKYNRFGEKRAELIREDLIRLMGNKYVED